MNIKVRRHKPFYKSFFKLRENVTNNLKLRSFKKKKWTYLVKRLTIFNRKRIKLLNHNVFHISKTTRRLKNTYRTQLYSKQRLSIFYGKLTEKRVKLLVRQASNDRLTMSHNRMKEDLLISKLESRLDTLLFRTGFFSTFRSIKQVIICGNVYVNNKKVKIASFLLRAGDLITFSKSVKKVVQKKLNSLALIKVKTKRRRSANLHKFLARHLVKRRKRFKKTRNRKYFKKFKFKKNQRKYVKYNKFKNIFKLRKKRNKRKRKIYKVNVLQRQKSLKQSFSNFFFSFFEKKIRLHLSFRNVESMSGLFVKKRKKINRFLRIYSDFYKYHFYWLYLFNKINFLIKLNKTQTKKNLSQNKSKPLKKITKDSRKRLSFKKQKEKQKILKTRRNLRYLLRKLNRKRKKWKKLNRRKKFRRRVFIFNSRSKRRKFRHPSYSLTRILNWNEEYSGKDTLMFKNFYHIFKKERFYFNYFKPKKNKVKNIQHIHSRIKKLMKFFKSYSKLLRSKNLMIHRDNEICFDNRLVKYHYYLFTSNRKNYAIRSLFYHVFLDYYKFRKYKSFWTEKEQGLLAKNSNPIFLTQVNFKKLRIKKKKSFKRFKLNFKFFKKKVKVKRKYHYTGSYLKLSQNYLEINKNTVEIVLSENLNIKRLKAMFPFWLNLRSFFNMYA